MQGLAWIHFGSVDQTAGRDGKSFQIGAVTKKLAATLPASPLGCLTDLGFLGVHGKDGSAVVGSYCAFCGSLSRCLCSAYGSG